MEINKISALFDLLELATSSKPSAIKKRTARKHKSPWKSSQSFTACCYNVKLVPSTWPRKLLTIETWLTFQKAYYQYFLLVKQIKIMQESIKWLLNDHDLLKCLTMKQCPSDYSLKRLLSCLLTFPKNANWKYDQPNFLCWELKKCEQIPKLCRNGRQCLYFC